MRLTKWQWIGLTGLLLTLGPIGRAQDEPEPVSELDRLPTWQQSSPPVAAGAGIRPKRVREGPNTFTDLDNLAQQYAVGQQIDALLLTGESIGPTVYKLSPILAHLRVLTLKNLTTNQADSLLSRVPPGAQLERLTIDITDPGPNRPRPNRLVRLPAALGRFRKLRELRIREDGLNWAESLPVLVGMKRLRRLAVDRWPSQPKGSIPPVLSALRQLRALELTNTGWVIAPETIGELPQLTELTLSSLNVDTGTLAAVLTRLPALETLRLTKCWRIETLPTGALTHLKTVELAYNDILRIDAALLTGLTRVERFTSKGNQVVDLSGLGNLTRLRYLNVMSGSQKSNPLPLPETIGRLRQLTDLRLYDLCLGTLPAGFGLLHRLRTLHLNHCGLDSLPDTFGRLTALREVTMYGNRLRQLPGIGRLNALRQLNVSGNQLATLPTGIGQLTRLTSLNISENQFTELPASLTRLVKLEQLSADHNRLQRLPDDLGRLVRLTGLSIHLNQLTRLPASLGQLTKLTSISADHNRLDCLPESAAALPRLRSLSLEHNQLTALPTGIGRLDSLRTLWVSHNHLRTLPASLGQLRALTDLRMDNNELETLPADLSGLRQLTYLSLRNLPLTDLPLSVGTLTGLQSLHIADTRLQRLPDTIGALVNLRSVVLTNNPLTALPDSIGRWQALTTLELVGNRLEQLPDAIGRLANLTTLIVTDKQPDPYEIDNSQSYCSWGFDTDIRPKPLLPPGRGLRQLPDSIIHCARLRTLMVADQPRLDADDVFRKAALLKSLTNLAVINCGITRLPDLNWNTVMWQRLTVRTNRLTGLPYNLVNAPALQNISARENRLPDALNRDIHGRQTLLSAFAEADNLSPALGAGPNGDIAAALLRSANEKGQVNDWEGSVHLLTKAIGYAPDSMRAQVYAERANLYQAHRRYAEALADIDLAILYTPRFRDGTNSSQQSIRAMLAGRVRWKGSIFADMGQYEAALTTLAESERLLETEPALRSAQTTGSIEMERGRYLLLAGKRAAAEGSYRKVIDAYATNLHPNVSIRLLMVDLCLVTGQYDRAQQLLTGLPPEQKKFNSLTEYLRGCLAILQGRQTGTQAVETLLAYRAGHPDDILYRRLALSDDWLAGSTLPMGTVAALRQLKEAARGWIIQR